MASEFPESFEEARQHILDIPRLNGLLGVGGEVFENALSLISELYRKPTHFLLELIQNADDNEYDPDVIPALSLSCKGRTLRLSCNERGFSKRNVEAICGVGRSTKTGSTKKTGVIGEKGVGFKSVFKAAGVVWIRSGHYSFKFDKTAPLGTLVPLWVDSPDPAIQGTDIQFELLEEFDIGDLVQELQGMDSRILLFLRRIKRIDILVETSDMPNYVTSLGKSQSLDDKNTHSVVVLHQNQTNEEFLVFQHTCENLPHDPKRPGISESEITLAFPLGGTGPEGRQYPTQAVYSFLPIRDYGFKFLLNADLVLNASREAIMETSAWNKALRDSLPAIFQQALTPLRNTPLQYSWSAFLPSSRPEMQDFFTGLEAATLEVISKEPVLESVYGDLKVPSGLKYVPLELRDPATGLPLAMLSFDSTSAGHLLHHRYHPDQLPLLTQLGVQVLSNVEYLAFLSAQISMYPDEYQRKDMRWHSLLAKQLSSILSSNPEFLDDVKPLPLVLLRDGAWTSTLNHTVVFNRIDDGYSADGLPIKIPSGLDIVEVDPNVAEDSSHRVLLGMLGVKEMSANTICEALADFHLNVTNQDAGLIDRFIEHITYMYRAGWKNPNKHDLWFVTEDGDIRRGSQLYVESSGLQRLVMDDIVATNSTCHIPFLNQRYYEQHSALPNRRKEFLSWLLECHELSDVPRLAHYNFYGRRNGAFNMTNEFYHVITAFSSTIVLILLKENWQYYGRWILPSFVPHPGESTATERTLFDLSRQEILRTLSKMRVGCFYDRSGQLKGDTQLGQTVLSRKRIKKDSAPFFRPFLDIPDPENDEWDFLQVFGVVVHAGMISSLSSKLRKLIERLETLSEGDDIHFTRSEVAELYRDIDLEGARELAEVQEIFKTKALIYVPPTNETQSARSWYTTRDCKWNGDRCLKKTPILRKYYPGLHGFFYEKLKIPLADPDTAVEELLQITEEDSLTYISGLFLHLARSFSSSSDVTELDLSQQLRSQNIFPIRDKSSTRSFDRLANGLDTNMWFIGDRRHLRDCFTGKVGLLAFSDEVFLKLRTFLGALGVGDRCLSLHAQPTLMLDHVGAIGFLDKFTNIVRSKVEYIARIIPQEIQERNRFLRRMLEVNVFSAQKLEVCWKIDVVDSTIEGAPESSRGTVLETGDTIEIYISQTDKQRKSLPVDVVEEIVKLSNINADMVWILHHILMENDTRQIEELLDRRGILSDPAESWAVFDTAAEASFTKCAIAFGGHTMGSRPRVDELLSDFLDHLEQDQATQTMMNKCWEGNKVDDMKALLMELCRRNKQSPSLFVPMGYLDKVVGASEENYRVPEHQFYSNINQLTPTGKSDKTSLVLPGILEITRHKQFRWAVFGPPGNTLDDEMMFFGELYVSRLFEIHLGVSYVPELHWTSNLRTRAGLEPVSTSCEKGHTPAFTIQDTSQSFWKVLASNGAEIPPAKNNSYHEFHVDVITLDGELGTSTFFMHPNQCNHFRKHTLLGHTSLQKDQLIIPVLAVVSRTHSTEPSVALLVDPYAFELRGGLHLEPLGHLRGRIDPRISDHIMLRDSVPRTEKHRLSLSSISRTEKHRLSLSSLSRTEKHRQSLSLPSQSSLKDKIKSLLRGSQGAKQGDFQYQPLASHRGIRLLELDPGCDDDPLQGKITFAKSVASAGQYCAMSYPWGDKLKPYRLSTPEGAIWITASCHSVLRRIRSITGRSNGSHAPQPIWIDAICINQSDHHEKTSQIRLMREIFQSAHCVWGWLGDELDDSALAIQTLLQIRANHLVVNEEKEWPQNLAYPPRSWKLPEEGIPPNDDATGVWRAIACLLERPWFKRAWITQEIVLSRHLWIICGTSDEILWDTLYEASRVTLSVVSKVVQRGFQSPLPGFSSAEPAILALGRIRRLYQQGNVKLDFLTLLQRFSYTQASLDRDKLFALLGLASDTSEDVFDPDYKSFLETVVMRYAREFVKRDKGLDMLYRAGISKGAESFASWIPNWTAEDGMHTRTISTWQSSKGPFEACLDSETGFFAQVSEGLSEGFSGGYRPSLQLTATVIDTITEIGDKTLKESDIWTVQNEILRKLDEMPTYPTGEPISEVKARLPIGDAAHPYYETEATVPADLAPEAGVARTSQRWEFEPSALFVPTIQTFFNFLRNSDQAVKENMWRYWRTAAAFSLRLGHGARYCRTSRGYAGLVPYETKPGDVAAIVHGAVVPFIFRAAEEANGVQGDGGEDKGEKAFSLIGECYIHGLMHGEGLRLDGIGAEKVVKLR
ncbi:hypothetical protein QBC35DRAFT_135831 [Podospora australis]|uniref:Heterokaryon incompatibility domain-containing protein n=1 Tax=Podospora australis TaxID=1536484 RepID=A0AAN6WMK2_9PEZI|nr:hypothetical protein QBC35DRAFT_135831 [Podospora australis]